MPEISALTGRFMYILKLKPVLVAEMGIKNFVQKAKKAKLSGVWIKVAEGRNPYTNVRGEMESQFHEVVQSLNDHGIDVWGSHVPQAATVDAGREESAACRFAGGTVRCQRCAHGRRGWGEDFSREILKRRIPMPARSGRP